MPAPIQISVINNCTVLTDAQIQQAVRDIQTQITRDFAPQWGVTADLIFVPKRGVPNPGTWQILVLDTSDEAGALGYHDVTTQGLPLGKVFAKTDLLYGASWTVTLSHEILEILVDPDCVRTVFVQTTRGGMVYAYEVCDACETDAQGYRIGSTLVSDFVFPQYFETTVKPGRTQMDQRGLIRRPFSILPGGYMLAYMVNTGAGWTYVTGDLAGGTHLSQSIPDPVMPESASALAYAARAKTGSRREKRMTAKDLWQTSNFVSSLPKVPIIGG